MYTILDKYELWGVYARLSRAFVPILSNEESAEKLMLDVCDYSDVLFQTC